MKVLAVVFALVALTSGFKIETKKAKLIRVAKSNQCGPDETDCPNGCCPEANWYCCADSFNCAATAADCPFVVKKAQLVVKLAKTKTNPCGPDDEWTACPAGCCPMANWFCCPDNGFPGCAPTAADCPFVEKKTQLIKMSKTKQCGPDETDCPGGCCPEANWYCCPDAYYCAATAADCPFVEKKTQLEKLAKTKTKSNQCGPDETPCPGGCCPEANWFCCPDATYCAATAADCPFVEKKARLEKLAKTKNNQCGPDETTCPNGCCPEANWFCCPDYMCAKVPEDCAFADKRVSLTVLS